MAKNDKKTTLLGCDYVETPREIIASDKNTTRKSAFLAAYERAKLIVPEFFIKEQRKRKNTSSDTGGKAFSHIIVTTEKVELETKDTEAKSVEVDKEREE